MLVIEWNRTTPRMATAFADNGETFDFTSISVDREANLVLAAYVARDRDFKETRRGAVAVTPVLMEAEGRPAIGFQGPATHTAAEYALVQAQLGLLHSTCFVRNTTPPPLHGPGSGCSSCTGRATSEAADGR